MVEPSGLVTGLRLTRLATLSLTELSNIRRVVWSIIMIPPPSAKRPCGATALAWLPEIRDERTVRLPQLATPPPSESEAKRPPEKLWVTLDRTRVRSPQFSMPLPRPAAAVQNPSGQCGQKCCCSGVGRIESIGLALFSVITESATVTRAPPAAISSPPPPANTPGLPVKSTDSGLLCARPPRSVTPLMCTSGRRGRHPGAHGEDVLPADEVRGRGAGAGDGDALRDHHASREPARRDLNGVPVLGRVHGGLHRGIARGDDPDTTVRQRLSHSCGT